MEPLAALVALPGAPAWVAVSIAAAIIVGALAAIALAFWWFSNRALKGARVQVGPPAARLGYATPPESLPQ